MIIKAITIVGLRSINSAVTIPLEGDLITIIGKNDAGKSNIVHALSLFFNKCLLDESKLLKEDFHKSKLHNSTSIQITLTFADYKYDSIDLRITREEDTDKISFKYMHNNLEIRNKDLKLIFEELPLFISVPAKRNFLEAGKFSSSNYMGKLIAPLIESKDSSHKINQLKVELYKEINNVTNELNLEIGKFMTKQTPEIKSVHLDFGDFPLEKILRPQIYLTDSQEQSIDIERRGFGYQSSLLVAIIQAYAMKRDGRSVIIAIEEPELYLHSGAQRSMFAAIQDVGLNGSKIIVTTHSPIFIDKSNPDGIVIVRKNGNCTKTKSGSGVLNKIRTELDIRYSDILSWNGIIFCEGSGDHSILELFAEKINCSLATSHINIIRTSGKEAMYYYSEIQTLKKLEIPAVIVVDRDNGKAQEIRSKLTSSKILTENEVFVTNRLEIENYLSERALRKCHSISPEIKLDFNDDSDIKVYFRDIVGTRLRAKDTARLMTADEIHEDIKAPLLRIVELVQLNK